MNRIYHVIIKGRTLESRDLKELLARAVNEKRNQNRKSLLQSRLNASNSPGNSCQSAVVG
jgi:hypothetical protein